ncbi:MAG: OsmC family protein, partial [Blastocatellia bacterium]
VAAGASKELATKLHEKAHHLCFIANSVNFPVTYEVVVEEE